MRKMTLLGLAVTYGLIGLPLAANAHPGGLDAAGCHQNNTTGMYECHQGVHAGTVYASKDEMEKGARGRALESTDRTIEADQKAKERAATEKADVRKARAEEKADKEKASAEQKVETTKAERDKTDANAKAEAKAEKKKAKAEEKAAKKKAKAEAKAAKEKAKAEERASR